MKNDDIINKLINDNIIDDIQADIDAELEKSEPDYDKIAELSALICEISEDSLSDNEINENIARISEEYDAQEKRNKIKIFYKWISALSACIVLVLALNAYTMVSFGDNLLKAVIEMTQSGFSIDFSGDQGNPGGTETTIPTTSASVVTTVVPQTTSPIMTVAPLTTTPGSLIPPGNHNTTEMPMPVTTAAFQTGARPQTTMVAATTTPVVAEENIGYTISEKCQEIGIVPCYFNYYTDMNFKEFDYEDTELSSDCYFTFMNSDRQLDIIIEQYRNAEDIPPILIPSDQNSYYVIPCSFGDVYLFEEDTHITAVFICNNAVYTIIGYNSEFSDMEEIIMSCSPVGQN